MVSALYEAVILNVDQPFRALIQLEVLCHIVVVLHILLTQLDHQHFLLVLPSGTLRIYFRCLALSLVLVVVTQLARHGH